MPISLKKEELCNEREVKCEIIAPRNSIYLNDNNNVNNMLSTRPDCIVYSDVTSSLHDDSLQGVTGHHLDLNNLGATHTTTQLHQHHHGQYDEPHGDLIDQALLDHVPNHLHRHLDFDALEASVLTRELLLGRTPFDNSPSPPPPQITASTATAATTTTTAAAAATAASLLMDVDFDAPPPAPPPPPPPEPCYIPYDSPLCLSNSTISSEPLAPAAVYDTSHASLHGKPTIPQSGVLDSSLTQVQSVEQCDLDHQGDMRQLPHVDLDATMTTSSANVDHQPILLSLTDGQQIQIEPSMAIQVARYLLDQQISSSAVSNQEQDDDHHLLQPSLDVNQTSIDTSSPSCSSPSSSSAALSLDEVFSTTALTSTTASALSSGLSSPLSTSDHFSPLAVPLDSCPDLSSPLSPPLAVGVNASLLDLYPTTTTDESSYAPHTTHLADYRAYPCHEVTMAHDPSVNHSQLDPMDSGKPRPPLTTPLATPILPAPACFQSFAADVGLQQDHAGLVLQQQQQRRQVVGTQVLQTSLPPPPPPQPTQQPSHQLPQLIMAGERILTTSQVYAPPTAAAGSGGCGGGGGVPLCPSNNSSSSSGINNNSASLPLNHSTSMLIKQPCSSVPIAVVKENPIDLSVISSMEIKNATIINHGEYIKNIKAYSPLNVPAKDSPKPVNSKALSEVVFCSKCDKSCANKRALRDHERIHSEGTWQCHLCDKVFKQKRNLNDHKSIHTGEKPFKCEICPRSFRLQKDLKDHVSVHSDARNFECHVCLKRFRQKRDLRDHSSIHSGEKNYACGICGKQFRQKRDVKDHSKIHQEKTYNCDICDKAFRNHRDYKYHQTVHTGVKPYSCSICHKKFRQNRNLRVHERIHVNPSAGNTCKHCQTQFKLKRELRSHEKECTGPPVTYLYESPVNSMITPSGGEPSNVPCDLLAKAVIDSNLNSDQMYSLL